MNWSSQIPTESGFYWIRTHQGTPSIAYLQILGHDAAPILHLMGGPRLFDLSDWIGTQQLEFYLQPIVFPSRWRSINTAPKDGNGGPFLVTNNINSRRADGSMSHVWLADCVYEKDGEYTAFSRDSVQKIRSLTHWFELKL
jgi:hypothetical protein